MFVFSYYVELSKNGHEEDVEDVVQSPCNGGVQVRGCVRSGKILEKSSFK